jgi:phage terminase large subunit
MIATRSRPSLKPAQWSKGSSGSTATKATLIADAIAQLPTWAKPLIETHSRYKCLYGGRGSGKSYAVVDALLVLALQGTVRVLCAREYQNSIKDSSHYLLSARIKSLGLEAYFEIQQSTILCPETNSEFIFAGLHHNIESIKSKAGITHCWVEEAQSISAKSWRDLSPTIREQGSEIWVTFNPRLEADPVYKEFVIKPDEGAFIRRVNFDENPYFTEALEAERQKTLRTEPELYGHVWLGELWSRSEAQVFAGKFVVKSFVPDPQLWKVWEGPYQGADFGFANDPTVLVRCWIFDDQLWIEDESYEVGLEIDDTPAQWKSDVPGCEKFSVRGDNSRPETISYLRRNGIPKVVSCLKGKGSVEDGIAHMKSFKQIVIHERCVNTANEFMMFSYKIDRHTDEILPVFVDEFNHAIDAIRYALELVMRKKSAKWLKNV